MEKEKRGIEQARGCCVILLKVCVFNWLIFMSSFVVRVHSCDLQRQVGQKLRKQSRGGLGGVAVRNNCLDNCLPRKVVKVAT